MSQPAGFTSRYTAPSESSSRSRSTSYDYSGLEDHIKRQDALAAVRDAKFASLYGGDVAGSVVAANKIRDLLKVLRASAPGTTERDPMQIASPLVRVSSSSSSNSESKKGAESEFSQALHKDGPMKMPPPPDGKPLADVLPTANPKPKKGQPAANTHILSSPPRISRLADGDGQHYLA